MAYSRLYWQNGGAPAISADNLNHMDEGIAEAEAAAIAAATLAGTKADDNAVVKKIDRSSIVYINDVNGNLTAVRYSGAQEQNSIVLRSTNGVVRVGTPDGDGDATTKKYVDDRLPIYLSPSLSQITEIEGFVWADLYSALNTARTTGQIVYIFNPSNYLVFSSSTPESAILSQPVSFYYNTTDQTFKFSLQYNSSVDILHGEYVIDQTGEILPLSVE